MAFHPGESVDQPAGRTEATKLRSVYGRGFFDGQQRMMETMNNSILLAKERGLTSVARKVYDATPIDEAWDVPRIITELGRLGSHVDHRVVFGCLASLRADGLVRELPDHKFVRVARRPRIVERSATAPAPVTAPAPEAPMSEAPAQMTPEAPAAKSETDPLRKMAAIADALRSVAAQIEDVALEFEGHMDAIKADSAKLRQLQELLKSIS